MNKELFIKKLNENNKIKINIWMLDIKLDRLTRPCRESRMGKKIFETTNIMPDNKRGMLEYLKTKGFNINKYNNVELEKLSVIETNIYRKGFIDLLLKYNKYINLINRLKKFKEFVKKNNGYITPAFTLNTAEGITISNPALQFDRCEIKSILGFDACFNLKSIDKVEDFLNKYSIIFEDKKNNCTNFMVIDKTLYFKIPNIYNIKSTSPNIYNIKSTSPNNLVKIENYEVDKAVYKIFREYCFPDGVKEEIYKECDFYKIEEEEEEDEDEETEIEEITEEETELKNKKIQLLYNIVKQKRVKLDKALEQNKILYMASKQNKEQVKHINDTVKNFDEMMQHLRKAN